MANEFWVPALRYLFLAALVSEAVRLIRGSYTLGLLWLMPVALVSVAGVGVWVLLTWAPRVSDAFYTSTFGLILTAFGAVEWLLRRRTRRKQLSELGR